MCQPHGEVDAEYADTRRYMWPWQCQWHCGSATECENVGENDNMWQHASTCTSIYMQQLDMLWGVASESSGYALPRGPAEPSWTRGVPKMDATLENLCQNFYSYFQRRVSTFCTKKWMQQMFWECWLPDAYTDSEQSGQTPFEMDSECKLEFEGCRKETFLLTPRFCHQHFLRDSNTSKDSVTTRWMCVITHHATIWAKYVFNFYQYQYLLLHFAFWILFFFVFYTRQDSDLQDGSCALARRSITISIRDMCKKPNNVSFALHPHTPL